MGVNLHVTEGEVKEATLGKLLALSRGVYEVTVEYQAEGTENTVSAKSIIPPGKSGFRCDPAGTGKTEEASRSGYQKMRLDVDDFEPLIRAITGSAIRELNQSKS
ncbi:MAG: hypothetical protein V8Q27_05780 [Eubacteriales bacterium]